MHPGGALKGVMSKLREIYAKRRSFLLLFLHFTFVSRQKWYIIKLFAGIVNDKCIRQCSCCRNNLECVLTVDDNKTIIERPMPGYCEQGKFIHFSQNLLICQWNQKAMSCFNTVQTTIYGVTRENAFLSDLLQFSNCFEWNQSTEINLQKLYLLKLFGLAVWIPLDVAELQPRDTCSYSLSSGRELPAFSHCYWLSVLTD